MKILPENHPSWLLLYIDQELTAEETEQAEALLRAYPDLRNELDAYLRTVQVPDLSIHYPNASQLYKATSEQVTIRPDTQDSFFVRYLDHELDDEEKKMVETYAATHPDIQKELDMITTLRMIPDPAVQFPDKRSLYRKKRKGTLLSLTRWTMTAAASLLFVTALLLLNNNIHRNQAPQLTRTQIKSPSNESSEIISADASHKNAGLPDVAVEKTSRNTSSQANKSSLQVTGSSKDAAPSNELAETPIEYKSETTEEMITQNIHQLPLPQIPRIDIVSIPVHPENIPASNPIIEGENSPTTSENTDIAWEEDQKEESTYAQRNPKMKMLFRKINRAAEKIGYRNSDRSEDQPLVRIAYMEIGRK